MATKRIVFPKNVIERAENYDFHDDGNNFKGYLYKGVIPITYTRACGDVFISIRVDYKLSFAERQSAGIMANRYNGVSPTQFNMNQFIADCEAWYKYFEKKA